MGILTRVLRREPVAPVLDAVDAHKTAPIFSTDLDQSLIYGEPTLDDWIYSRQHVARDRALAVPAVKRARDLIANGIGQFPLQLLDVDGRPVDWQLFDQLEADTAPSVSVTRIVDDLFFYGVAWLRVTRYGWHRRPVEVQRLDPATVNVQNEWLSFEVGSARRYVPVENVIRIDSPTAGLLNVGAAAINTYLALSRTTYNAANALPPLAYFTPTDGDDPLDDAEVIDVLTEWENARRARTTAYVPAALKLNALGWSPEQIELTDLRDQAVLEIARLTGVDPEELGVSTTSRTYANTADRHRQFLDFTLGPIMTAIEGRLSMADVTPAGYRVDFDDTRFLRSDDLTRAQTDAALINAGVLTIDEARAARDLPPLTQPTEQEADK